MKKIVCVIAEMPRDNFWLPLSIKSYIDWADKIVIIDGTLSNENPLPIYNIFFPNDISQDKIHIIHSSYDHSDKGIDGKQRGKYLSYIKEHFSNDLAIVVDSDEVLADNAEEQVNSMIKLMTEHGIEIINPRMEHFVQDLWHVDATQDMHFCPGRVFKITEDLFYPENEHPIISSDIPGKKFKVYQSQAIKTPVFYYHYAYIKGLDELITKFNKHIIKSEIHTEKFLNQWKNAHISGTYPKKDFLGEHPKSIKEEFKI